MDTRWKQKVNEEKSERHERVPIKSKDTYSISVRSPSPKHRQSSMQLLNSKNGSSASSFKRASTHTPLPPSVLHACSFHPSPFFPSIAWGPCSPLSLFHLNTPPPSCLVFCPFHHTPPPLTLFRQWFVSTPFLNRKKDSCCPSWHNTHIHTHTKTNTHVKCFLV